MTTPESTAPAADRTGVAPEREAEVLADVTDMLARVIGEDDFLLVDDVTMSTSFNDDLELESIEFVALAEQLQDRYGTDVDFVSWVADMELDALIEMQVGTLVEFVTASLDGPVESSPRSDRSAEGTG
ncbi:MAG: phosphopantetheine-binding protein [Actinomycetota bacterium]